MTMYRALVPTLLVLTFCDLAAAEPEDLQPGDPVDYAPLAFQPDTWKEKGTSTLLLPWTGENLVFLSRPGDYDSRLMTSWVRALDGGWQLYAELTGARPQPLKQLNGKATIAAVPGDEYTCGAGCGYVGHSGIELAMFYNWNYPELKRDSNAIPHYVFYEMGRNFYTFGDRHSCFTTGFAVFMRYVCMDALKLHDVDADTRKTIERAESLVKRSDMPFLRMFTPADGLDEKAPRLKDAQGNWVSPSDQPVTYASAMLRLRRQHGGDEWVQRFFRELATCPEAPGATRTGALEQCWSWYLCASVAAKKDLSPVFCDEWHLPLSKTTRDALSQLDWTAPDLRVALIRQEITPKWDDRNSPKPISGLTTQ
jgi:hypothetical protein